MTTKRRRSLPPIDPSIDHKMRPLLEAVKEILETGDGVRGDPLDRKLTIRDLVDSGLAAFRPGSQIELGPVDDGELDVDPPGNTLIPPRPTGFNAIGSFGYIVLSWDIPGELYGNHAYTNIYRSETDNFANAELIGRDAGMVYTDHVRETDEHGEGFYYWITFTSIENVEGPTNSTSGTYAEVIPDLGFLLDRLSGEINEDVLTPAFKERLEGFQETISELGDRYTLSITNNGHVAGWTIYNSGETSDFAVLAGRFTIANEFGAERHPFIVVDGNTYIDTAFIREASIQEGQLGPIGFGKITDPNGNPVTTLAGKLKGELIEAENLRVAESARFYGDVFSNNYLAGVRGWAIRQSGNVEFNQGQFNGVVNIGNVSGVGALATKNAIAYEDLAGSTAPIVLQRANAANLRVNDWTRPTSTRIDGNKIFTGDAYVDTLQIKGQAITIPASAYTASTIVLGAAGGSNDVGGWNNWKEVQSLYLPESPGPIQVTCSFRVLVNVDGSFPVYAKLEEDGVTRYSTEILRATDTERFAYTRQAITFILERPAVSGQRYFTLFLRGGSGNEPGLQFQISHRIISSLTLKDN
ncbi:hypothetical protein SAMN04487867_10459 [Vreelandella titanicae]|uniref:phage tail tip fiber protein n=1 Tax=Vreelandella titanicae TaxID=664683 RepID=UPI00089066CC|nr:hypothetical protein [Halomonas titanicae]SDI27814.1 hypothetical protein SAMN04487867_10459 [Halomonas titanicae]